MIGEVSNSIKRNIRGITKPGKTTKGENVKNKSKRTRKQMEKSEGSKEVEMGDPNELIKRKLDVLKDTGEADIVLAKRSKLEDVVSLGKVFEEQFGSAEVAKQCRQNQ